VSPACPLCIGVDTKLSDYRTRAVFYAFFTPPGEAGNRSFTRSLRKISVRRQRPPKRWSRPREEKETMSVLDGVSLVLATGLFIYLLVALLRADRS